MKNHLTTTLFLFLVNFAFAQNLKPSQFVHIQGKMPVEKSAFGLIYTVPKDSALVITTASIRSHNDIEVALYNKGVFVTQPFTSSTGIVFRSGSEISIGNTTRAEVVYTYNIIGYLVKDE